MAAWLFDVFTPFLPPPLAAAFYEAQRIRWPSSREPSEGWVFPGQSRWVVDEMLRRFINWSRREMTISYEQKVVSDGLIRLLFTTSGELFAVLNQLARWLRWSINWYCGSNLHLFIYCIAILFVKWITMYHSSKNMKMTWLNKIWIDWFVDWLIYSSIYSFICTLL